MCPSDEPRVLTRHPDKKAGVHILKRRYDQIRDAIMHELSTGDELSFKDLTRNLTRDLKGKFDGQITWYAATVKLDLEAQGMIERVKNRPFQTLRLTKKGMAPQE